MNIDKVLSDFVGDFSREVWKRLKSKGVDGVGVSGSYARGNFSKSRPDINFAIFAKKSSSDLLISLGEIASSLDKKYSHLVNLRPDLHPERFAFPWGRDTEKKDLFFKIAIFDLSKKDLPMPFNRPGFIVEAHKSSLKMLHGAHYFGEVEISSSNEEVMKGVNYTLGNWSKKIKYAPISYNLKRDVDLFFNEALSWGKLAVQQYAWVQGIKNGLDYSKSKDRKEIFDKVHNKKLLRTFLELSDDKKKLVELILDARLNYDEWKLNKKKAIEIYKASEILLGYFLDEAKKLGG